MNKGKARRAAVARPTFSLHHSAGPPVARLAQAQALISAGQLAAAEATLKPALDDAPQRPEALYLLGIAALMAKRPEDALAHTRAAVALRPAIARYHFALGRALKATHDLEAAAAAYRRAIELQPDYAEAMVSLGIVLKDRGELDAAIALYERALRANPTLAAAHANRAHALALRAERSAKDGIDEEPSEAVLDAQGRAVALEPRNAELHRNYGVLLRQARHHEEAIAAFNEALTLDPTDVESCLGLGRALADLGGIALECEAYQKWLAHNPANAPVMRALAGSLTLLGEADTALRWADQALALDPDPVCMMQAANVLQQLRRVPEALARSRQALDASDRMAAMYAPHLLGMNYLHEESETISAVHEEFGSRLAPPIARPPWRAKAPGKRLRVGYVSGDFVRHSVSFFVAPLLEHHDSSRFEISCYHNNARSDHVTARLKSYGHRWIECAGLSDDALARRIVADGIDILVDLSGPTAQSRLLMFALAPAPVQITYLGYPTRSGVPSIDFRITDWTIDDVDSDDLTSELPLRLPRTMFCYRPDEAPALVPPPCARNGWVTFGSFNNTAKVVDHTLELWAAVLRSVPNSRLLLKAASIAQPSVRQGIERFMAERGVAAERISLHSRRADDLAHLELYNEIDIALDTFPYNGATTTCEALWMGLPVVTRRGRTHTSRMGASLLGAIGRGEWVADTDAEYVSRAVALATDPQALAAWRASAREHMASSPLLDHASFARRFEAVLEQAWDLRGGRRAELATGPA